MWQLIIIVTVGLSIAMFFAWGMQRSTANSGWADVVWTFALGAAGIAYALFPLDGKSPTARQWLVAAVVAIWSARLGLHIAARTLHGPEDSRYAQFRRDWGETFQSRMAGFLQIQAFAAALLALSMLVAARNPRALSALDVIPLVIILIAVVGEAVADRQLRRFRAENGPRICDAGLWSWSRHPNYFFEWLGWCAYPLFALAPLGDYNWGWLALSGPIFMYWLLVHVSGIPPLEQQMLRSRGDAFRAYQARVSPFFLVPPR